MANQVARVVTVHGQVQGVFFRDTTRRVARSVGVVGWVANEADGTVLAWLEGEAAAVEQVLRFVEHGPPEATVSSVEVRSARPEHYDRFEIR